MLPTLHPIGLTIPEALKLRMGPPHPVRQRGEIHLRRDQKIRHCGRRRSRLGHLPARHKHPRRRKSLSRLNLITEREPRKKMRTAKRRVHIAHRDCLRERLVDETLHGRKSLRPLRLKRHCHFRSGNRGLNPRSFRIEMRLTRLKIDSNTASGSSASTASEMLTNLARPARTAASRHCVKNARNASGDAF